MSDYHAKVSEAVAMLEAAGLHRPSSHIEWAFRQVPQSGDLPGGSSYFRHGTGCHVAGPEWAVDFDFGPRGEINGIDPHRLYRFSDSQLVEYGFASVEEIEDTVQDALSTGDLVVSNDQIVRVSEESRQR